MMEGRCTDVRGKRCSREQGVKGVLIEVSELKRDACRVCSGSGGGRRDNCRLGHQRLAAQWKPTTPTLSRYRRAAGPVKKIKVRRETSLHERRSVLHD